MALAPPESTTAIGLLRDGDDLILQLRIQAGASRNAFCGTWNDCQKLAVHAPPVDGAANKAIQQFLAKAFGVAKRNVNIEKGTLSKLKRVRITAAKKIPPELQIK